MQRISVHSQRDSFICVNSSNSYQNIKSENYSAADALEK